MTIGVSAIVVASIGTSQDRAQELRGRGKYKQCYPGSGCAPGCKKPNQTECIKCPTDGAVLLSYDLGMGYQDKTVVCADEESGGCVFYQCQNMMPTGNKCSTSGFESYEKQPP